MNSNDFRPLNENEKATIWHLVEKRRISPDDPRVTSCEFSQVSYETMQGGFCICIIKVPRSIAYSDLYGNLVYRGASRRSYKDPRNPIKGEMRAFSRAILYSHPVEI